MSGLDIPGCSYEYFGQSARVEAPADRARVLRLSRDDRSAERLEPVQPVIDLDAELFSLGNVLLCRVHEHREMIQQRPLGVARVALVQLDEGTADLHARLLRGAGRRVAEAEPLVRPRGCGRVAREQRRVV